jgi:hypothetical protein
MDDHRVPSRGPWELSQVRTGARGSFALVLARPLEVLEDVAVGVEEERLHEAVAAGHRAAREWDAGLGQTRARGVQVVHLEGEVVGQPVRRAQPGVGLTRAARRVRLRQGLDPTKRMLTPKPRPSGWQRSTQRQQALRWLVSLCRD